MIKAPRRLKNNPTRIDVLKCLLYKNRSMKRVNNGANVPNIVAFATDVSFTDPKKNAK